MAASSDLLPLTAIVGRRRVYDASEEAIELDPKTIGKAIRRAWEEAGYEEARTAAEAAGISPSLLSKWVRGRQEPRLSSLMPVLESWDLSLAEFESIALGLEGRRGPYQELIERMDEVAERVERIDLPRGGSATRRRRVGEPPHP